MDGDTIPDNESRSNLRNIHILDTGCKRACSFDEHLANGRSAIHPGNGRDHVVAQESGHPLRRSSRSNVGGRVRGRSRWGDKADARQWDNSTEQVRWRTEGPDWPFVCIDLGRWKTILCKYQEKIHGLVRVGQISIREARWLGAVPRPVADADHGARVGDGTRRELHPGKDTKAANKTSITPRMKFSCMGSCNCAFRLYEVMSQDGASSFTHSWLLDAISFAWRLPAAPPFHGEEWSGLFSVTGGPQQARNRQGLDPDSLGGPPRIRCQGRRRPSQRSAAAKQEQDTLCHRLPVGPAPVHSRLLSLGLVNGHPYL